LDKPTLKEYGLEFAILTNEITHAWTGLTTKQYKKTQRIEEGKSKR